MEATRFAAKHRENSQEPCRQALKFLPLALLLILCIACPHASAKTSRFFPENKSETGKLRLAEVMALATREEILHMGPNLEYLHASGLKDSDFKDGSVAMARVYCCHPSTDAGSAIWFYVPSTQQVQVGDLVVVRMGRNPAKNDAGMVNVAVEVREHKGDPNSQCSWDPPDTTKWARVLYCKWMPAEGWTLEDKFLHKAWLKSEPAAKP